MIKGKNEIIKTYLEVKNSTDDTNIHYKELIKETFLNSDELIYALNNDELKDCDNDEYFGVNILPYLIIPETQTNIKHYVCYKVDTDDVLKYNEIQKYVTITFIVMCDVRDNIEKSTGLTRHDLIGNLIKDRINWSNIFGLQCKLISDKESVTDTEYATRKLVFQQTTLNSITKTTNGVTKVINNSFRR